WFPRSVAAFRPRLMRLGPTGCWSRRRCSRDVAVLAFPPLPSLAGVSSRPFLRRRTRRASVGVGHRTCPNLAGQESSTCRSTLFLFFILSDCYECFHQEHSYFILYIA